MFTFVAAVTRSVGRRLGAFGVSRRVFDNFNGAESPWVRLVALLDLSETRPLSASADSPKIGIADTKMGDRYRSPSDFSLLFLTVEYERMYRYFQLDLTLLFIRKLYISVLDCDLYIRIATINGSDGTVHELNNNARHLFPFNPSIKGAVKKE